MYSRQPVASYVFLALILLFCEHAWAQESGGNRMDPGASEGESAACDLDPVVVTADRGPAPLKDTPELIQVVTARDIERLHASTTGEVLEALAGVNVESGTGSGFPKRSVVSLNGFPANYVLVLVNGQKLLTEHIHTGQNVDIIPPESIVRIEIIKTAASAQYGSDAVGGVVNIITRREVKKSEGLLYGAWGRFASVNAGLGVSSRVGEDGAISMFADFDRSDGPPVLAPKHRLDNMGYDKVSLLANMNYTPCRWLSADLYANWFENRMDWKVDDKYQEMNSRLLMPKADIHLNLSKEWRVTSTLEYSWWEAEVSSEQNKLLQPKVVATWDDSSGRNRLVFGGEYLHNWFGRTGLDEVKTQHAVGFFVHDRFKLSRKWSFSASLRLDAVENIEPVLSPKGAILFRPIEQLGIRVSAGRGFHAPTLQELYEQAYGHGGTAYRFGSDQLEPETGTATSLSIEWEPVKELKLLANGYFHMVDNFITPEYEGPWEEDPTKDKWVRQNILEAWLYGGEGSFKWHPTTWLWLGGAYGYATNRDKSDDKQLRFHPGHSVSGDASVRFTPATNWALSLFGKVLYRAGRSAWNWKPAGDAPQDNEDGLVTSLEDFVMVDAGAKATYKKRYMVHVKVSNLLGEDVQRLDDVLTTIDGMPVYQVGFKMTF